MTLFEHYIALSEDQKRAPTIKPVVDGMAEVLARLTLIQNAADNYFNGKSPVIQFSYSSVQETLGLIGSLSELAARELDIPWDFIVTLNDAARELRSLRLVKTIFTTRVRIVEGVNNVFDTSSRSRKAYQWQHGDTLRGIAQRFLHDAERWLEIASINNLEYPYSLAPNTLITLPLDAEINSNVISKDPADLETLYGRDVMVNDSGYLEFLSLDLKTVAGAANLEQALRVRLSTPKGQLPLHVEYGTELDSYIGQQGGPSEIAAVGLETRRTVRQDARIASVQTGTVSFEGTTIRANVSAYVIGKDAPESLNIVINRAA